MSIKYGFYNARYHDKVYDAENFAAIFDGIINDGVFMNVGTHFTVTPSNGLSVAVGPGRAWFNSTWTLNDADFILSFDRSDAIDKRIDAVVLDVNALQRVNTIKIVKGTPSTENIKPTLTKINKHYQYPLAYVTIRANATTVINSDIQNVVGLEDTPYVSGILKTADITDLYLNWEDQFNIWFDSIKDEYADDLSGLKNMTYQIPKDTADYIGLDGSANTLRGVLKAHNDHIKNSEISFDFINGEIANLKAADISTSQSIIDLRTDVDDFNSKSNTLSFNINQLSERTDALETATNDMSADLLNVHESLSNHESSIDSLGESFEELSDNVGSVTGGLSTAVGKISSLESSVEGLQSSASQFENDISDINTNVSALQIGLSTTNANLSSANSNIGSLQTNLNTANNDIDSLENRMATAEQNISNLSTAGGSGVTSFNGRTGSVTPQNGDYTAAQVGAVPTTGGTFSGAVTFGGGLHLTSASPQDTNMPYFLGINAFASGGIVRWVAANGVPAAIGAVPITRTINGINLSTNINLEGDSIPISSTLAQKIGLTENYTVSNALDKLSDNVSVFTDRKVTVTATSTAGSPVKNLPIKGIKNKDGSTVYTNDNGIAVGYGEFDDTVIGLIDSYIDLQCSDVTINTPAGSSKSVELSITVTNFKLFTQSTSGIKISPACTKLDVSVCGGGGGGGTGEKSDADDFYTYYPGGGGGGYSTVSTNVNFIPGNPYNIVVGNGGNAGSSGGSSSAFGVSAYGGSAGKSPTTTGSGSGGSGNGDGGSGGRSYYSSGFIDFSAGAGGSGTGYIYNSFTGSINVGGGGGGGARTSSYGGAKGSPNGGKGASNNGSNYGGGGGGGNGNVNYKGGQGCVSIRMTH